MMLVHRLAPALERRVIRAEHHRRVAVEDERI
jgi:hypothetical protein